MTRTYLKFCEDFRRRPKMSQDIPKNSEVLKKMIQCTAFKSSGNKLVHLSDPVWGSVLLNMTSFPMLFLSEIIEIRDFGWVPSGTHLLFQSHGVFVSQIGVSLQLLGSVSIQAVVAHIFHPGVRIWSISVRWCEIGVFSSQAWNSCLRCESWQV